MGHSGERGGASTSAEDFKWWSFATPQRVSFGVHTRQLLPDVVRGLGERVLVCTDGNLVSAGVIGPLVDSLRSATGAQVVVYDEGQAEIGFEGAERCVAAVRDFNPSVVVGIGGGSNLDLAKVAAARLVGDWPIEQWSTAGLPQGALPVVALPTTAGTGSEVTPIAVLTDERRQIKVGFQSHALLPRFVLVDPVLTLSCPPMVTAFSGMDALSHAVESLLDISFTDKPTQSYDDQAFVGKNPYSDALATKAISLIARSLITAVREGDELGARTDMALGSLLAGMAFASAGTAIIHALQYPLGALTKTAHGHGNAVLMPSAVRFNSSARLSDAAAIARIMGATTESDDEAAARLPDLLANLAIDVGITPTLRSIGVVEADLESLATAAMGITRLLNNNPVPVDHAALVAVLRGALDYLPGDQR